MPFFIGNTEIDTLAISMLENCPDPDYCTAEQLNERDMVWNRVRKEIENGE